MLACLLKRVVLEEQFISSCLLPHLLKWLVLKRACLLSRTLLLSEEVVTEECAMCCHEVITMVEVAYPLPPRNKLEVAHSVSLNYLSMWTCQEVGLPHLRRNTSTLSSVIFLAASIPSKLSLLPFLQ